MSKINERNKLVDVLSETPFINYACKKVGIARATVYRWMKDNPEFKEKVGRAVREGRENFNEIGESALIKKVKEGDLKAIKFYLSHNNRRYLPKERVYLPALEDLMEFDAFNQRKTLPDNNSKGGLSDSDDINWLRGMGTEAKAEDRIKVFHELMREKIDMMELKKRLIKKYKDGEIG